MRYLLDTNVVSDFIRRRSSLLEQRMHEALRAEACAISVLTRAELRFGQALMAPDDGRRALVDGFLGLVPHLPWTAATADCFGRIKAHHRLAGRPRGDVDMQIAAHAIAEDLILVTHNVRHFEDTPGLVWEDWWG
jgi:predicted nucleic acid-binding protein